MSPALASTTSRMMMSFCCTSSSSPSSSSSSSSSSIGKKLFQTKRRTPAVLTTRRRRDVNRIDIIRTSAMLSSDHHAMMPMTSSSSSSDVAIERVEMLKQQRKNNSAAAGFVFDIADSAADAMNAPAIEIVQQQPSGEERSSSSSSSSSFSSNEFVEDVASTTSAPDVVVQSSIKDAMALIQAEEREAKIASGEIVEPQRTEGGFFGLLADSFEKLLLQIQDVERALGIPYPVGNSIIILTALVKLVTFPLTKSQVVSSLNMKNLQPQVAAIKEKYEDDPERMNSEINRIYEDNEVNPLAGCGPLILTLPVFIGLYRAFKNAGIDGVFDEPWLFIPNLSGPSDAQDISWLWPLDDDFQPPLDGGWEAAWPYLVMPILTTATQFYSMNAMQPKEEEKTEEMKNQSQLVKFLPFFIGYISLTVPAGLAMYWLFNNVFTTLTQVYLRNFGGAVATVEAPDDILIKIPLGCAVVEDSFERVPNDEIETYLQTNPSVKWNEEWLEEWRQQQAQEISESVENAENEMVDLGASEEVAALYAEKLKNRAKRYRDVEKRKNATPKDIEDLIVEYTKEGKSQEDIAILQKMLEATIKFEAEMKEKKLQSADALKVLKEAKGLNLTGEASSSSSSSSSEEEKTPTTR